MKRLIFILLFLALQGKSQYMTDPGWLSAFLPSSSIIITNFSNDLPIFSNEVPGGASSIASAAFIEGDVSTFRYHNAYWIFGEPAGHAWGPGKTNYLTTYPLPISPSSAAALTVPRPTSVSFYYYPTTTTNQFEFVTQGGNYEMVVGTNISQFADSGSANLTNVCVMCTFTNASPKHIILRTGPGTNSATYGYFAGLYVVNTNVIAFDTQPTNTPVMFFGDSYTTGYGEYHLTNDWFGGYPYLIGNQFTNVDVWCAGSSGTGFYQNAGSAVNYTNRVWQEIVSNYNSGNLLNLVIAGSPINDNLYSTPTNTIYGAATNFFAVIASNCPNMKVIVITGWNAPGLGAYLTNYCIAVGGAAAQFGYNYYSPAISNIPSSFDLYHPTPAGYVQMQNFLYPIMTNLWGVNLCTNTTPTPVPTWYDGSGYPFITGVTFSGMPSNAVSGTYGAKYSMFQATGPEEFWSYSIVGLGLYCTTNSCTNSQLVAMWNSGNSLLLSNLFYPSGAVGWLWTNTIPSASISGYGTGYYVAELETNGGNPFFGDLVNTVTVTPVGSIANSAWYSTIGIYPGFTGHSGTYMYGPENFKYKTP